MRRFVLATFGVAVALVFGAEPVSAAAPQRFPLDPVHDTAPAGLVCPFNMAVDSVSINETLTILGNGRVFITGASVERVSNLDTGKSVDVNVSGPVTISSAGGVDTFVARGRNLWRFDRDALGPGQAGSLLLTTGLAVLTQSASGITFTHNGGTTENLCETLR